MFRGYVYTNHGRLLVEYWSGSEVFPEPMFTVTAPLQEGQLVHTFGMGLTVPEAIAKCCRSIAYYNKRSSPGRVK